MSRDDAWIGSWPLEDKEMHFESRDIVNDTNYLIGLAYFVEDQISMTLACMTETGGL